jgi:flagellin FlaB
MIKFALRKGANIMFSSLFLNKDEKGQAALETAIILIAFVVVASVFAFAILSAGSASTDKGKQAISAGLEGVQSSMSIKGSATAKGSTTAITDVVFDLGLVAGGSPVDLTDPSGKKNVVVVSYLDGKQTVSDLPWKVTFVGQNNANNLLENGELAEMDVDLSSLTTPLAANTQFTIEIKPPTGSVIKVDRTTPAAIAAVMELN